jgi:hypothetical protein
VGSDDDLVLPGVDGAARQHDVLRHQHIPDVGNRKAELGELSRRELDPDRIILNAVEVDPLHPVYEIDLVLNLLGNTVHL